MTNSLYSGIAKQHLRVLQRDYISQQPSNNGSFSLPDMTAMLDVIFILMVFLLLTANAAPKALKVDLPEDVLNAANAIAETPTITVSLMAQDDKWGVNERELNSWSEFQQTLLSQLAASSPQPQLLIIGDQNASLKKTLQLLMFLEQQKLSFANFMMQPPSAQHNKTQE